MWTRNEAIFLCCEIEAHLPTYGFHVGLTGGLLYKGGERKDCDLIFYRIRQYPLEETNFEDVMSFLMRLGFDNFRYFGFCVKCDYKGKPVDLLFPEPAVAHNEGGYPIEEEAKHPDPLIAAMNQIEHIGQAP